MQVAGAPLRIAVGGIMHESNTFLPLITDRARFVEGSWTTGTDLLHTWADAHHEMGGFIAGAAAYGYEVVPTSFAWATPAGPVDDKVVDEVVERIVADCRRFHVHGVLLALHGAMVTAIHASADTEVLRRVRESLGPNIPIVATLDYHANCTVAMAEFADALVGYQTYPHIDQRQRGLAAANLVVRHVKGVIKPVCFISKPPLIINILGQETEREPMRSLMASARSIEQAPGMLSVSIMAGFPYADVPDMGSAIIAVADQNRADARACAEHLSQMIWNARTELNVSCPDPPESVRRALTASRGPVVLVDLGDNVGGGSAGDGTVLVEELLRQKADRFVVTLFSPQGVGKARTIGVGGCFDDRIGGAIDDRHGQPVHIRGRVRSLHDGPWIETEPRHGGRRQNDQGATAVIETEQFSLVVLNSLRTPPFSLGQLTSLDIDPSRYRILVVKAAVAYKAAYAPIAGAIIETDTPGLTAVNPARFAYRRIRRPIYPLDALTEFRTS